MMRDFLHDLGNEVVRAEQLHAPFHSLHEAYAVILEEVDELWDEVRKKNERRDPHPVRAELVQIAAMCWRAARDLGLEGTAVDTGETTAGNCNRRDTVFLYEKY